MEMNEELIKYIEDNKSEMRQLLLTLAGIPAPSNHEEKRAEFVRDWHIKAGAEGVYIDEALNVIYPIGVTADNPLTVFMAHTDVVFPDTSELPVIIEDGKIKAPGVGDDTANLVGLLFTAKYIAEKKILPKTGGMLIVANAGEEGLGNLKGSKEIFRVFGSRIKEFTSFDGYYGSVCADAVGSKRYRVEIKTEGGHSYGAFGNRNAIAYLASMIDSLYTMKVPDKGRTTYNVGLISGGTSVNTIAQQAEMLYEYRSDSREDIAVMDAQFNACIEYYRAKGVTVNVEILGERPCNGDIDEENKKALVDRAVEINKKYTGKEIKMWPGSTDCNVPLSMGIPAVCYGVVDGGLAHTREEYIYEDSLEAGYKIAFESVLFYY